MHSTHCRVCGRAHIPIIYAQSQPTTSRIGAGKNTAQDFAGAPLRAGSSNSTLKTAVAGPQGLKIGRPTDCPCMRLTSDSDSGPLLSPFPQYLSCPGRSSDSSPSTSSSTAGLHTKNVSYQHFWQLRRTSSHCCQRFEPVAALE